MCIRDSPNGNEIITVRPSSSTSIYDADNNNALPPDYVTSGLLLDLNSKDCNSFSPDSSGGTNGSTWNDLSGNNTHFTTVGSPLYDINNGFIFETEQITNYFLKSSFPHPTTTYSDEFFIKTSRKTNSSWKSYNVSGNDNQSQIMYLLNSDDIMIIVPNSPFIYTGVNSMSDGNWHHFVKTSDRSSGEEKIYLDGDLVYESVHQAGDLNDPNGSYVIGQDQDSPGGGFDASQAFEGYIPVVRMYDKVLTASEITQNYNHLNQSIDNNNRVNLNSSIYLDNNGVTVKCEQANIGETGEINGKEYTVVDEATLRTMVGNQDDVTCVCTSLVTNTSELFEENAVFNQDIGSWNTSQVTQMSDMFNQASSFNHYVGDWDTSGLTQSDYYYANFAGATAFQAKYTCARSGGSIKPVSYTHLTLQTKANV